MPRRVPRSGSLNHHSFESPTSALERYLRQLPDLQSNRTNSSLADPMVFLILIIPREKRRSSIESNTPTTKPIHQLSSGKWLFSEKWLYYLKTAFLA